MTTRLGLRALNRAALARQFLLDRADVDVHTAVAHLGGLQAQEPQEPFVGLWSRLRDFDPAVLSDLLVRRRVVRTLLMRRTVHLVTDDDALAWRPRHRDMLVQRLLGAYRAELAAVDLDEVAALVRDLLSDDEPRTMPDIGRFLAQRWPDATFRALGEAAIVLVPMVQIPPRGLWREAGAARYRLQSSWLGPAAEFDGGAFVRRYLAAFGPASSSDLRAWCGVAGLPAAVASVREELVSFRDDRGRELLDLPDAPRPDPDTPAPVRFLPAFDNAILGYDDRTRIVDDAHKGLSVAGQRAVLVDGRVAATWTSPDGTVVVSPLRRFTRADRTAVGDEAREVSAFLSGGASRKVRIGASPR